MSLTSQPLGPLSFSPLSIFNGPPDFILFFRLLPFPFSLSTSALQPQSPARKAAEGQGERNDRKGLEGPNVRREALDHLPPCPFLPRLDLWHSVVHEGGCPQNCGHVLTHRTCAWLTSHTETLPVSTRPSTASPSAKKGGKLDTLGTLTPLPA